jgi:hypothetical protein
MVVYPDGGYHCFGCGAHGRGHSLLSAEKEPKYVEDVAVSLSYIDSLPVHPVRGLSLHRDAHYYYVVWPGGAYYKRRTLTDNPNVPKYKGPTGVPKPLFQAQVGKSKICIVIEGELNALSLCLAFPELDIISPGAAGDFVSHRFKHDLPVYLKYDRLLLVADKDKPGATAVIQLKAKLLPHNPNVGILLMEPDANDILVQYGPKALEAEVQKSLDLLS